MRIDFELETHIARPRQAVFDFVTDPANLHRWDPRVVEAAVVDGGPVREGAQIREVRRAGPRRLEQTVRVVAFEAPRSFGMRIEEGPIPVHGDLSFADDVAGGTNVRLHAHGEAPGPGFLAPVVRALGRRQMRAQYRRLKRLLEASG